MEICGVSAITNSYPASIIVTAIATGLAASTSVLVSQYFGAKEIEKVKKTIGVSYILATIMAVVSVVFMILTSSIWLKILNTPEEIFDITRQYLIFCLIGNGFNFALTVIMEGLRAIGNSKVPLIFVGITTTINLILDPIFINMGLGVTGAGIATMIAIIIGMIIAIIYINKKSELLKIDFKYLKLDKEFIKQIIKVGGPMVLEDWFVTLIYAIEVTISNESGVIGSASYGVVEKVAIILFTIGKAFGTMMTVTVGQFIGNKQIEKTKDIMKNGLKLVIIPTIFSVLVLIVFPRVSCRIFVSSEEVIESAIRYLGIVGIAYSMTPIRQVFSGFIMGTGHTKVVLLSMGVASTIEVLIILVLKNTGMDNLIMLGIGITAFVFIGWFINLGYYLSKKWQKEVIVSG